MICRRKPRLVCHRRRSKCHRGSAAGHHGHLLWGGKGNDHIFDILSPLVSPPRGRSFAFASALTHTANIRFVTVASHHFAAIYPCTSTLPTTPFQWPPIGGPEKPLPEIPFEILICGLEPVLQRHIKFLVIDHSFLSG